MVEREVEVLLKLVTHTAINLAAIIAESPARAFLWVTNCAYLRVGGTSVQLPCATSAAMPIKNKVMTTAMAMPKIVS
jgi:hypothetical protein